MLERVGNFARVRNRRTYFARVTLAIEPAAEATIELNCTGKGWIMQGYFEEVPEVGYDNWKAGARVGILFALHVAAASARVLVSQIVGMTTDTNPSVVAAAAALAVWQAVQLQPAKEMIDHLEEIVFRSGDWPHDYVPTLQLKEDDHA